MSTLTDILFAPITLPVTVVKKAADIFLPDQSEVGGVTDPGAEEKLVQDWKILREKLYPEAYTYNGPAQVINIKFKGVSVLSLKPDWLLDTLIWAESKKADITLLKATIKERRLQLPYLPDIVSEYELIVHYHESPMIIAIGALIVGALIGVGFVILSAKAPTGEDWHSLLKETKGIAKYIGLGLLSIASVFAIAKFKS